jgi:flagellar basal-body rod protein FlgB
MAINTNIINYLESAMRAEGTRQQAIANNIANMNTPGFRRSDIDFQDVLSKAINSGDKIGKHEMIPELLQPHVTALKSNGNDVHLEHEIGEMVKNTLRHKTFMLLLRKKYGQYKLAMGR